MKKDREKILVLGSGPIRIGQAAEFDYSGSQACRALHEEGKSVVLLNSNPATIQTDCDMADYVYLRPLLPEVVEEILEVHHPTGVLATLGGQTALNLLVALDELGIWQRAGVRVLGTPVSSVKKAEKRESFRNLMVEIGQPVVESLSVSEVKEALFFSERVSFPLIVRPDFTLGGEGGGVARSKDELAEAVARGLRASPVGRVLVERYLEGWREIELEMLRDAFGDALCVCGMENLDPMGIHTGDSVVVAPPLTLCDSVWQKLRSASLSIVEALDIRGACNVQLALSADEKEYAVIEVNPRASRSSALASKATGYPIARMAAKIAVGRRLAKLANPVTGTGSALAEPALDYVALKYPCWPFDKFPKACRTLGMTMKSTGEVLALGADFPQALSKALRSIDPEGKQREACLRMEEASLWEEIVPPTDRRILAMLELLRRGKSIDELCERTSIHPYFVKQMALLAETRTSLEGGQPLSAEELKLAKTRGLCDEEIGKAVGLQSEEVALLRQKMGLTPAFREVDGCAGEHPAGSRYLYGCYGTRSDEEVFCEEGGSFVVLGSGPIRIGQGIEFDYCCVKAVQALRALGKRAVLINDNPETVSTDHDLSDALYLEPLTAEDTAAVLEREKATGVFVSFGGQTALKLGKDLQARGFHLLGTPFSSIEAAEDRGTFSKMLEKLEIAQPEGGAVGSREEAFHLAERLGFPLMVRPSFVIGGLAMHLVNDLGELDSVLEEAFSVEAGQSVLIDRFLSGQEFELDALCDGRDVLIPGIFEHLDPAGVHSGDSMAIYPEISLEASEVLEMERVVRALSEALSIKGLFNVQFVKSRNRLYVIEANPRASRTVPIASKLSGLPLVELAVQIGLGGKLKDLVPEVGLVVHRGPFGVKVPVFSMQKLEKGDPLPGPQMQSTGEALGVGDDVASALIEGFKGAGWRLPRKGRLLLAAGIHPMGLASLASSFTALGWKVASFGETASFLKKWGVPFDFLPSLEAFVDEIHALKADLVLHFPKESARAVKDGFSIRRSALDSGIPCLMNLPAAEALVVALTVQASKEA